MHGLSEMTIGGLRKEHLRYNSIGKIVSKKASDSAKRKQNLGIFVTEASVSNCFKKSPKIGTPEYHEFIKRNNEYKQKKLEEEKLEEEKLEKLKTETEKVI